MRSKIKTILISALVIILMLSIVLMINILSEKNKVFEEEQTDEYYYELVFENETNITSMEDMQELIEAGSYNPTRSFVFDEAVNSITLPDVYIRTVNLTTGVITYEQVDTDDLVFFNQDQVYIEDNQIYAKDGLAPAIDNSINIRVNSTVANIAELCLQIRVLKEPILVEKVTLFAYDNSDSVGLTESKYLTVAINPVNASFRNYESKIEKIVKPDGTVYQDDLSQYAYIEEQELFTTRDIQIGSEIYISAQTISNEFVNAVKSNVLVMKVERIAIENIIFSDPYRRGDINLGETMTLGISIFPENATINVLQDSEISVTLNDESIADLVKLDERTYVLTASDEYADLNKAIKLTLSTEDYVKEYVYLIGRIPIGVDSIARMEIHGKATGKELPDEVELCRNDSLELETAVIPADATVGKISYNLYSETPNFGAYISVSDDGILNVADFAPIDLTVYLSASTLYENMAYSTKAYKIVIVRDSGEAFA